MSVDIMHAVSNEFGKARGGKVGDPSGKEVTYGKWYAKNSRGQTWAYYIEILDPVLAENAARMAEQIVDNPGIGYGQEGDLRGTLYSVAKANGGNVTTIWATCDCSSMILAIFALLVPGFSPYGSTATMLKNFQKFPSLFRIYADQEHLFYDDYATRGGVYLRTGHVLMVLSNGRKAGTTFPEEDEDDSLPASAPICKIVMDGIKEWCNVRQGPGTDTKIIGHAKVNEVFDVYTVLDEWYCIDYRGKRGYIYYELASEKREGNV